MTHLTLLNLAAVVVVLAAVFGYLNYRLLRLPQTIGLVVIAFFASLGAILLDRLIPGLGFAQAVETALQLADFDDALLKGMLGFLLFAGALHVDMGTLVTRKWAILSMATVGVLISTAVVGVLVYVASSLLGLAIPLLYCLVFGALISPTDPVAVMGILKTIHVPPALEAKIAGESLFNDGIGVVVFTIIVVLATTAHGGTGEPVGPLLIAELFAVEVLGGALVGLGGGYLCYRALKSIDEHNLEVLITLALVMALYGLAGALHFSGPIAVVCAGLLIGNQGTRHAMSEVTRDHVQKFWSLIDEILNAVLFLLIGFEVVAITFSGEVAVLALAAIPIVLAARFLGVGVPLGLLGLTQSFTKGAVPVLTWGGLRGGISVALVLSLPASPYKEPLLAVTYAVVIFSIVVQGLTIKHVVRYFVR